MRQEFLPMSCQYQYSIVTLVCKSLCQTVRFNVTVQTPVSFSICYRSDDYQENNGSF
jgi:hypothetical protein